MAKDVRAGRVESIEGAIRKRAGTDAIYALRGPAASPAPTSHLIWVANRQAGDQQFDSPQAIYEAAPEAGMVRIYYLPTSRWVVNLELLPDPPVEDVSPEGVNRIVGAAGAAWERRDMVGVAEARAQLPALERELEWYTPRGPIDAGEPVDQAALLGTWSSPFLTLEVRGGGTLTVRLADGSEQPGQWSIDPSGRLSADVFGARRVIDASIADDALTLVIEGQAMRLRRSSGT